MTVSWKPGYLGISVSFLINKLKVFFVSDKSNIFNKEGMSVYFALINAMVGFRNNRQIIR
jgi:hypothetical protein